MRTSDHIKNVKELFEDGRCLHFDSGERCDEIISAHSIQKSGQLKSIIEDDHVSHIDPRLGSVIKNEGGMSVSKISWNKVSTFNGFCQFHDNDLFSPIDDLHLVPTNEQVLLYSFRCLCREYFVKENACRLFERYMKDESTSSDIIDPMYIGTSKSFEELRRHKTEFDYALANSKFSDILYTCFLSKDEWHTQFSGVLYPDFDFLGHSLQDLRNVGRGLDLITYFTAPVEGGWAFVFAWHKSSDRACQLLLSSLASVVHGGKNIEDILFRFSIKCCENHAFRTSWWEGLKENHKKQILEAAFLGVAPGIPIPSSYLSSGLEGIASWSFQKVVPSAR